MCSSVSSSITYARCHGRNDNSRATRISLTVPSSHDWPVEPPNSNYLACDCLTHNALGVILISCFVSHSLTLV